MEKTVQQTLASFAKFLSKKGQLHRDCLVKKPPAIKTEKVYGYKSVLQYHQYLTTKHAVSLRLFCEMHWESFADSIINSNFLALWA